MLTTGAEERRVRVAGFWHRSLAAAVDTLIVTPLMLAFMAATTTVTGHPLHHLAELGPDYLANLALDGGAAGLATLLMAMIVPLLYFGVFQTLRGQTPAERMFGLCVIDMYGHPPSLVRTVARTMACLLALAAGSIGLLWIAFDREKRGLHDWIAGTYVVRTARAAGVETAFIREAVPGSPR